MIIKCEICNYSTNTWTNFSNHIKSVHKYKKTKEYYDKYLKADNEGICPICGKETKYKSISRGYFKTCSATCNNYRVHNNRSKEEQLAINKKISNNHKSSQFLDKISKTKFERYGNKTYNNIEKQKQTIRNRSIEEQLNIKQKREQTCLEKYGVTSYLSTQECKNAKNKIQQNKISAFEDENNCISVGKLRQIYGQAWRVLDIPRIIDGKNAYIDKQYLPQIEKYTFKNHYIITKGQREITSFLNKYNIISNSRKIISPYELDIYIPQKNIAIEYNGIYWHSINAGSDKNYHLNKTKLCEEKNIQLIHIFEWEWLHKQEICKSIILSAFGQYKKRIYARNCEIKEVDSKIAKQFLDDNHIQGSINSSYRLGLFYKDELVQLICIGKSRFKKDEYELLRMCTKLNTQVVGGFSKLMKHQPYKEVISYVDRSKFTGEGYLKCGWKIIDEVKPGYSYYKGTQLKISRNQAQKHKLKDLLGENNFDASKTEQQNMIDNGWLQVYDCGNYKMKYFKVSNLVENTTNNFFKE